MHREQELQLIDRCIDLHRSKTTTAGAGGVIDAARYTSAARFEREQERFFTRLPAACVHSSELPEPDSFRRLASPLGDLLVTRDTKGQAHIFHNACRHRGSTLVLEDSGSAQRLTCPYHAWSYHLDGALASVSAQDSAFPDLDKSAHGLVEIPSVEKYGFVWSCPVARDAGDAEHVLDAHLGDMRDDLAWLGLDQLFLFERVHKVWNANWKILTEGGMESYHFAVAHRDTIAAYFLNNTALSDDINGHNRMVLPTRAIEQVLEQPREARYLRDFTHINYTIMGSCGLLTQKEHVDWFTFRPLSPGQTEITIRSLVPDDPRDLSADQREHWARNLDITVTTLDEDFVIGEGIQASIEAGAVSTLNFGRNEWALKSFNDRVDAICGL